MLPNDRRIEDHRAGGVRRVLDLEEEVAGLSQEAVQRQVVLLLNAHLDLCHIRRQHDHIYVAPCRRARLRIFGKNQSGLALRQFGQGRQFLWFGLFLLRFLAGRDALPHDVLYRPPVPPDLGLDTLPERPELRVIQGSVQTAEYLLAPLLDTQSEARLEAKGRLVPDAHQVLTVTGNLDLRGRFRVHSLFRSAQVALTGEEGVGKGGGVVVRAPGLCFPVTGFYLELLCLGKDVGGSRRRFREGEASGQQSRRGSDHGEDRSVAHGRPSTWFRM